MSRRQNNGEAGSLAELMLGIERYGDDRSPQNRLFREVVRGFQLGGCPFEATTPRSTATWRLSRNRLRRARKTIRDTLSPPACKPCSAMAKATSAGGPGPLHPLPGWAMPLPCREVPGPNIARLVHKSECENSF